MLHRSDFTWLARPPDLSPLDISLECGKSNVLRAKPSNITQLRNEVREVLETINVNALQSVIANFADRIDKYIESCGVKVKHGMI